LGERDTITRLTAAPKRSAAAAKGAPGQGGGGTSVGGTEGDVTMAPQVSAVKVAAQPSAAAAQPDPATMSARDRIRMHVQKNLQKQQQQQQALQQQQSRTGGGAPSKKAHGLNNLQLPTSAPARKRPYEETRTSGDGSPTWETNTPPSGLSVEEEACTNKRRRAEDGGLGGSDVEDGDDFGDTDDGMAGPSPQQGMLATDSGLIGSFGEIGGATLFENPHDDGTPHERVHQVVSPPGAAAEEASSGFDSPPCETGWTEGDVPVGAPSEPAAGPGGVVDDEWVKGLYDMEGME